MNTFKRAKVVMLPTNEKAHFACGLQPNGVLKYCNNINALGIGKPQHLYIISDDEIKEGDWMYLQEGESPLTKQGEIAQCKSKGKDGLTWKKIIATTDSSLKIEKKGFSGLLNKEVMLIGDSLPQPSPSFIEKYIESYNNGNPIVDVMVETVIGQGYYKGETIPIQEHLKIDKNNTITIKKVKDSYTEDELKKLLRAASRKRYTFEEAIRIGELDKWIQDNL